MPITAFQREVLQVLAAGRTPESFVGGGLVLNRADTSPRYSDDVDFFHDVAEQVQRSAEADTRRLSESGYTVEWKMRQPYLHRARVRRDACELGLDWCFDSAFRFFPVEPDPEFGFCLHQADVATNKVLALASRSELRDYIDVLHLHASYLSLGALSWAASGKDPGMTPLAILAWAQRHVRFQPELLASGQFVQKPDLIRLKALWQHAVIQAEELIARLPPLEIGCLYLDSIGQPVTPDPASRDFSSLTRHHGFVGGTWPKIA